MFSISPHSKKYTTLRNWLKSNREASGMTLRQLAEKLGVHHSILGKIESGDRKLELFEYINYCKALDIDPSEGLDIINK